MLCEGKDYAETVKAVDAFLPYVDNRATCDSMSPKVFKKHKTEQKAYLRLLKRKGNTP